MGWFLLVAGIDAYAAWYSAQHHYAPLLVLWLIVLAVAAGLSFLGQWLVSLSKATR